MEALKGDVALLLAPLDKEWTQIVDMEANQAGSGVTFLVKNRDLKARPLKLLIEKYCDALRRRTRRVSSNGFWRLSSEFACIRAAYSCIQVACIQQLHCTAFCMHVSAFTMHAECAAFD